MNGTILLVDDDRQMLRSISDILRLSGYSAVIAGTGREAIDIARRHGAVSHVHIAV
jgi:CheY-like chemotaxis protein